MSQAVYQRTPSKLNLFASEGKRYKRQVLSRRHAMMICFIAKDKLKDKLKRDMFPIPGI